MYVYVMVYEWLSQGLLPGTCMFMSWYMSGYHTGYYQIYVCSCHGIGVVITLATTRYMYVNVMV